MFIFDKEQIHVIYFEKHIPTPTLILFMFLKLFTLNYTSEANYIALQQTSTLKLSQIIQIRL